MNFLNKSILTLSLCLCSWTSSRAEEKTFIIVHGNDGKVEVQLTDLTKAQLAKALSINANQVPEGDAILILEVGKPMRYSTKTLKQAFHEAGGIGEPEIILFDPDAKITNKIEIETLNKTANSSSNSSSTLNLPISPLNGIWQTTLSSDKIKGCPTPIVAQFSSRMNEHTTEDVIFSRPFHPNDLKDGYKQLKWQKKSANDWAADALDMGPSRRAGAPNMSFKVSTNLQVVSEVKINVQAYIDVQVAKELAFALGGSTHCSMSFKGVFEKK